MKETLAGINHTVGVWSSAHENVPARDAGQVVRTVEDLGFSAYWFPESWFRESLTSATSLLSSTDRLVVATGITSIWGRDAVASLNAARTLNAAYDDRFILGLGVSHQPLVERLRGHSYTHPVDTMREYLTTMDVATSRSLEADHAYARVIAALGPRMLEVAARYADGAHSLLVNVEHTASARQLLGDSFLAVGQALVIGESRDEFLRRAHEYLEFYTGLENYRAHWRRLGFGDQDFVRGGSNRLCDALVIHAVSDDAVRMTVTDHVHAGANHVCLQPLNADPTQVPAREWAELARIFGLRRASADQ